MAELVITDEERKAATYLDWSDEAIGKACKKVALILQDNSGEKAMRYTGAAVFIIAAAIEAGSEETTIELENATNPEPLGSWKITLEKVE